MVIFDQLRISDNGKRMYINIHVNNADIFKNIYLNKIYIMTSDRVSETLPEIPTGDCIYTKTFDDNIKEAALVLTANDFTRSWETEASKINFKEADISKTLFFVYVECRGILGPCTPCTFDEKLTVGVTFDEKLLYQRVMDFTRQLADSCNIPVGFADFILLWNAFKAAVETCHYIDAIKYWKMLFDIWDDTGNILIKGCGCHG